MFRSFWRLLARTIRPSASARPAGSRRPTHLELEALEDRWLPNATTIAGFVYNDANSSGIKDSSENGIGSTSVELHHADGSLVATTTTDANGHYIFTNDPTVNVTPQSKEYDTTFPSADTNWSSSAPQPPIQQFDPSLGTLTSIEIISQNQLNVTDVKVENAAPVQNPISVQLNGQFTLAAAGYGTLATSTTNSINDATVLAPGDGTENFTGPGSFDFGPTTADTNSSVTLDATSKDLSAFIGTGTVHLTETATVNSSDTGNGNFDQSIRSKADGTVRVIYNYIPTSGLKAGDYYVEKTTETPNFLDGQTTSDNIKPIPNSLGAHKITVTLDGTSSSLQNNFAEVQPASLSGFVYHDLNDNTAKDSGEPGLGATVTLSGTDVNGNAVNLSTPSNADGSYSFNNLWSGTDYTITESTLPSGGYLAPSVSVGSQGGAAGAATIAHINLGVGVNGANNNFGHVLPSSLAGFVYFDPNNNGVKETGEMGLTSVAITLTGKDDLGNTVFQTANTATDGSYSFSSLRPGSYTISKAPPPGYINGIDTPGSLGGTTANDQLFVMLGENKIGTNYNFGELNVPPPPPPPPPPIIPNVPPPVPLPPPPDPGPPVFPPFSKLWFLS